MLSVCFVPHVVYLLLALGRPAVQSTLASPGLPVHSRHPDVQLVDET